MDQPHLFDAAIALQPAGVHCFNGATHAAWANMVGPFGGISAATLLNAVLQHPERLGDPVALTINYAGAVAAGAFQVVARPARTNRSTQHWVIEMLQPDPQTQQLQTVLTGTAMTALRRDTWAHQEAGMPSVPAAAEVPRADGRRAVEWVKRYDLRMIVGGLPTSWEGQPVNEDASLGSLTQLWMRDDPPRPLDFCAVAALADVFFPRIWLQRATLVPLGTVTMTVYFHATAAEVAATGTQYVLGQARGQRFGAGYFDHGAQLWNADGLLLATTHQVVYYKH